MNIVQAYKATCSKGWTFDGRTSRSEFWLGMMLVTLATAMGTVFFGVMVYKLFDDNGYYEAADTYLDVIALIGCWYYGFQTLVLFGRRMHDLDKSLWMLLWILVPFGILVLLIFCLFPGTYGDNKYGPDPEVLVGNERKKPIKNKRYKVDVSYTVEKSVEQSTGGVVTHIEETTEHRASIGLSNKGALQAELPLVMHRNSDLVHFMVSKDLRTGQLYVSEIPSSRVSNDDLVDSSFWDLSTKSKKVFAGLVFDLQGLLRDYIFTAEAKSTASTSNNLQDKTDSESRQ